MRGTARGGSSPLDKVGKPVETAKDCEQQGLADEDRAMRLRVDEVSCAPSA